MNYSIISYNDKVILYSANIVLCKNCMLSEFGVVRGIMGYRVFNTLAFILFLPEAANLLLVVLEFLLALSSLPIIFKGTNNRNSTLILEHNLNLIKIANHIIDLDLEDDINSGEVIAQDSLFEIIKNKMFFY